MREQGKEMSHGCKHCDRRKGIICTLGGDVYAGAQRWAECKLRSADQKKMAAPFEFKSPAELIAESRAVRGGKS